MDKKIPLIKLTIDPTDENTGVELVSLVDRPAIERQWMAFNTQIELVKPEAGEDKDTYLGRCIPAMIKEGMEQDQAAAVCYTTWERERMSAQFADSYDDYPQEASNNAKVALRWAEENGWGECGTSVGKARANQLANGEPISRDTIARMAAFERHRQNSQKELGDGCGRLMWLAWGGDAGVEWAQRKLEQIDRKQQMRFAVQSEEKRIVSGPLMMAGLPIYRRDDDGREYYVQFDADTVRAIVYKYFKAGRNTKANLQHTPEIADGVFLFESWITDETKPAPKGFDALPDGSWFGSFKVDNDEVWAKVKDGTFTGFSVEGVFIDAEQQNIDRLIVEEVVRILSQA